MCRSSFWPALFLFTKSDYFCTTVSAPEVRPGPNDIGTMKTLLFLGNLGMGEILIIAFVVLLLFGGKKIPELMKGLGKGVKSFKEGMTEIEKDINDVNNTDSDKK